MLLISITIQYRSIHRVYSCFVNKIMLVIMDWTYQRQVKNAHSKLCHIIKFLEKANFLVTFSYVYITRYKVKFNVIF